MNDRMQCSSEDRGFRDDFEAGRIGTDRFHHRDHLRLAYVYLCESTDDRAHQQMRESILQFLMRHRIDPDKYHETLTAAWMLAVRHFMQRCPAAGSFDEFCAHDARLLDTSIMHTHYSHEVLFGPQARQRFVQPDLQPIPVYE